MELDIRTLFEFHKSSICIETLSQPYHFCSPFWNFGITFVLKTVLIMDLSDRFLVRWQYRIDRWRIIMQTIIDVSKRAVEKSEGQSGKENQSIISLSSRVGTPLHFGPYHYGSHYSNCGIVVHYLTRISPFTQIALEYQVRESGKDQRSMITSQDNNFDIPDRLFNSIEATWRLASRDSTTDFKVRRRERRRRERTDPLQELIPEFFFLPEFLQNRDRLELGTRQGGERVGDVKLPSWTPPNNVSYYGDTKGSNK